MNAFDQQDIVQYEDLLSIKSSGKLISILLHPADNSIIYTYQGNKDIEYGDIADPKMARYAIATKGWIRDYITLK